MFSFFTMIPIKVEKKHMDSMNSMFWLVPVVGLFYGLLLVAVYVPLQHYVSPLIAAIVSIFVVEAFNRFLHMDGTIDLGDGLTVSGTKEDHIRALKDTNVGAGGVCTGIFVILIMALSYAHLGASVIFLGFAIEIFSKNAQVATACFGNPSDGMASDSVRNTNAVSLILSSILCAIFAAAIYAALYFADFNGYPIIDEYAIVAVIGFFLSIIWGFVLAKIGNRNFGFVNGDILGASNETFKALFSVVAVIVLAAIL